MLVINRFDGPKLNLIVLFNALFDQKHESTAFWFRSGSVSDESCFSLVSFAVLLSGENRISFSVCRKLLY